MGIDYSFIRLKDNFADAKHVGDSPEANPSYSDRTFINLSTNEAYFQITNVEGGISLGVDYEVHVVDCGNNELLDITNKVFIQQVVTEQGINQIEYEIVNIGKDFYYQTVYLRFTHTVSDAVYWSNGINITDYNKHKSSYFQYKNYNDFQGIAYTSSQKYQTIRLRTFFDIPINESEVSDYIQSSAPTGTVISARMIVIQKERYKIEYIDTFNYIRLNMLLAHNIVYIDCIRQTNKPIVESEDREGGSNWFTTNFVTAKRYTDKLEYSYQIYEGFNIISFFREGVNALPFPDGDGKVVYSNNIQLNTGTISIYDSNNVLNNSIDESDMFVDNNILNLTGLFDDITVNDNYYLHISSGLVTSLITGEEHQGINDSSTWVLNVQDADFLDADFDSNDFLT